MFQCDTNGLFAARTDLKCGPTLNHLGAEDVSPKHTTVTDVFKAF